MFERYTEKARRVIFFARYEASQLGQVEIGDAHLLLGLMREDPALLLRLLPKHGDENEVWTFENLRRKLVDAAGPRLQRVSTSVDMPLSNTGKRVLAYAAEEAERLGHRHIGTEHLLLGLLRERECIAATVLRQEGFEAEQLRRIVSTSVVVEPAPTGVTARAGRGFGMGGGSSHISAMEFTCDGMVIASVVLVPGSPHPRAGEQIVLKDKDKDGGDAVFRVEDVSYWYERYPPDMVVAPHRLAKVVVRVKRDQPQS